jgi:glutamine cyclotransferase
MARQDCVQTSYFSVFAARPLNLAPLAFAAAVTWREMLSLTRSLRSLVFLVAVANVGCASASSAPVESYTVVAKYPHSTSSYTEGFFYLDGLFYEGTGLEGHSQLLAVQPATGEPRQHIDLPPQYFGEGIVDWGSTIYEWTWKSHVCFAYDRFTLRVVKQFSYEGEGWGMTRSATELITSDGSDTLRFRDPANFKVKREIVVRDGGKRIDQLNELEYVKGEIYANVWHSDRIARISPRDGHVLGWIDLTGILPDGQKINAESVLNGIAYDSQHDRLFVTGKQWPTIFEIRIKPPARSAAGK